jgi:hypothetical protein
MSQFHLYALGLLVLASQLQAAVVPPGYTEILSEPVGPGVTYQKLQKPEPSGLIVHVLEADLNDPRVNLRAVPANDRIFGGRKTVSQIARQQAEKGRGAVVGAINGDFFDLNNSRPTSSMIVDGMYARGYTNTPRSVFAFTENREASFGFRDFSGQVKRLDSGATLAVTSLNGQRVTDALVLYNIHFGAATGTNTAGTEVRLRPLAGASRVNAPFVCEVVAVEEGIGNMGINPGEWILSGHGTTRSYLAGLAIGSQIELSLATSGESRPLAQMMGGGPRLLTAGEHPADFNGVEGFTSVATVIAARSAIGITANRRLQLVVVDGGSTASPGVNLLGLATLLKSLGSVDAINLDGGGSSTLVAGSNYTVRNTPSDGSSRQVASAIVIETEIPLATRIAGLDLEPSVLAVPLNGSSTAQAYATDHSGVRFPIAGSAVWWERSGVGEVNAVGTVSALNYGYGVLRASAHGYDAGGVISVQPPASLWGWRKSAADGNLGDYEWFSTTNSYARGLALGLIAGEPSLLLMNRSSNAWFGNIAEHAALTEMNRTGITGGSFFSNDVELSADGVAFAGNLTTNATSSNLQFRVYQWNDGVSASPTRIINYADLALRLGDKITVTGSVADRTATLYAAASAPTGGSANVVLRWSINADGSWPAAPAVITLPVANKGTQVDIAPLAPGANAAFWAKGNGFPATLHSATGELLATLDTSLIPLAANAIAYLEFGGRAYLAAYLQGAGQENARIIDLTDGPANAKIVLTTQPLGSNANTAGASGDVAWLVRPDQSEAVLAVLATNNGVELIGLPNPALVKPPAVIASSTNATIHPPYTAAEFWVAVGEAASTPRSVSVAVTGDAGISAPSVTLPAGRTFVRLPIAGTLQSATGPVVITGTLAAHPSWMVAGSESAQLTLAAGQPPSAWNAWLASQFNASELADPSVSGPAADPLGQGWPNLLRFGLGLSFASTAAERQAAAPRLDIDAERLRLSYTRPSGGQPGVDYIVEASQDLATWTALAAPETVTSLGDGRERVQVRDTAPIGLSPRRFLRLRLELK